MHELDSSELVSEPQGSEAASDESDKKIKDPGDSPAIAQGSTSLEPLEGELLGDAPGTEDEVPQQFGSKRMREAGMTSEAVMRVCIERAKEQAGPPHHPSTATSLSCEGREGGVGERQEATNHRRR
jgi:hypothetical protein